MIYPRLAIDFISDDIEVIKQAEAYINHFDMSTSLNPWRIEAVMPLKSDFIEKMAIAHLKIMDTNVLEAISAVSCDSNSIAAKGAWDLGIAKETISEYKRPYKMIFDDVLNFEPLRSFSNYPLLTSLSRFFKLNYYDN